MDVLSDTLRVVRLSGGVFLNAKMVAPWAVATHNSGELARYLRLPSDCVALFHIVVSGQALFALPGQAPVVVKAGDAVLLPHNSPHVMSSELGLPPVPMLTVMPPLSAATPEGFVEIGFSGLGEHSQFLCGFLHCDQRFNPLLGALPELLVARPTADGGAETQQSASGAVSVVSLQPGEWLDTTLRHTVQEALGHHPGASDMLARLSEILFVEMVRRYMQQLPSSQHGWLAGVQDPIVGQTLRLLHAQPERPWTVESLADAVAVSRSTLAQRFTLMVGETPMRYLATWRMQLAKSLLRQTSLNLVEVAVRVGYDSDVAFNRAFKRHVGQPPATWRATRDSA